MSGYGAGGYGDPAGGAAGPAPTGRPGQGASPNPQGYPYAVRQAGSPYAPPVPPQGHPYNPYDQSPYDPGRYNPYAPYVPPPVEPSRGRKIMRAVLNPLYAAQRTFRPSRTGIAHDPQVRRLQLWRTVLGLAAWVGLTLAYKAVVGAAEVKALADDRLDQSWSSVLVLVCTFPVVVGVFVAAARGGLRRVYLRRALRPLGAVLAVMASMGTSALAMAPELAGLRDAVGLPGKIVIGVLCLWSIGFALYGIGLSLVHVFRTADIHEVLPPVLAGVLVWETALLDVVTGAYTQVPAGVRAVFVLGAPVTVTALSWWELRRLRRHHGLTVRGALGR
ncbi:hypothetical protein SLAV_36215 [Streptomyces lavendulae subsp. lavendulae]|uniref:Uncharacterized protein n=1 Tax=Streptomyces lavendulae subsp. lavendulae TaxID=58340 RepID=A0A2K8PRD2_STRLA|nr:hypothetical protein [Streptomyces lavendulae]ATZ29008.1 hypothetical protein SLAV_36215 [Streptomyces lavendulae subsp. lavendulae]QUQ58829.1 hypothetical protein SLLC_34390 [Streptomyces lavendulae subsp. lavendulae]